MMDDEFYELCYEAWMTGHSPDDVSVDEYDRLQSRGFSPDEISLNDLLPIQREDEEEVKNDA